MAWRLALLVVLAGCAASPDAELPAWAPDSFTIGAGDYDGDSTNWSHAAETGHDGTVDGADGTVVYAEATWSLARLMGVSSDEAKIIRRLIPIMNRGFTEITEGLTALMEAQRVASESHLAAMQAQLDHMAVEAAEDAKRWEWVEEHWVELAGALAAIAAAIWGVRKLRRGAGPPAG